MYQSRLSTQSNDIEIQTDAMLQVKDNLYILVSRLENDLRNDVFPKEVTEVIDKIRFMTDLHTVAKEIHEKGSILVGSLRAQTYLNSLRSVTNSLCKVSDAEIIDNYKSFL